ncbi:MAG: response regulator [Planctomycetota bacterium]|nr:response regulator [Planctomycetota bacterium]
MIELLTPSILITDDDEAFRDTLREMLEPLGYQISVASNGEEALDIVQHRDIHLLLLDMHMPRLTGVETARRVMRVNSRLPWILLSARVDESIVRQAKCENVFSILSKPVTRFAITENVQSALRQTYNWPPLGNPPIDPSHTV